MASVAGVLGLGALTLLAVGRYFARLSGVIEPSASHPVATESSAPSTLPSPAPSQSRAPSPAARSASDTGRWEAFRSRFGNELSAEFGRDGRLESVKGAPGQGRRAGTDFTPEDPQKAIARAREVLDASRDLLGVQPGYPLEAPVARTGPVSTQVTFQETHEGVPVAPMGSVTVDLGPQGELLGMSSGYVRDVKIVNSPAIDADSAQSKAVAAIPDLSSATKPTGGNPVIWVSRPAGGGAPEGRHAFEYFVQGRRVIVDASSGEILHRRDQRDF